MIQQEIAASDTSMQVEACSNTSSKIINSDAPLGAPAQAKKKRKRTSNHLDNAKCTSVEVVEKGTQTTLSKSLRRRRKKALRRAAQSLESKEGADSSVEVVEKGRQTTLSNGSNGAISPGCVKNTLERDVEVVEKGRQTTLSKSLRRRRNKALRRRAGQSLESKEGADSSVEVVEKGSQITLSNGSGGAISPGCVKNTLEIESGAGHVTSVNVEEDKLVEMHLDGCSDIKHASRDSMNGTEMDNSGEDFKQVKRAKLNVDHKVLRDVHSADASTRLCNLHSVLPDSSVPVPPGPQISELFQLVQYMGNKLGTVLVTVNSLSDSVNSLSNRVTTVSVEALVASYYSLDVKLKNLDKKVEYGLYEMDPDEA